MKFHHFLMLLAYARHGNPFIHKAASLGTNIA